ncbi:MAG TPA: 2-oxo acid dehydrogenase subunit E2, partial [Phnomibacter sp.]|nr:2-oxo acid dehydrogenase subunit E2 [Phnomibacter sp.]
MALDITVPSVGESISEVTLAQWLKKDGDYVERDEVLAELESEKATFEINAIEAGILQIVAAEGDTLKIGDVACRIDTTAERPAGKTGPELTEEKGSPEADKPSNSSPQPASVKASPVAAAIIADKKIDPKEVTPSGPHGRILKQDVLSALENPGRKPGIELNTREEKAERMSNLRKTVSRRLVEAKNTTAMLTTFNEVDMGPIMELRKTYKETFNKTHGVNLGFMSFFTKACCFALQEWPAVNAKIDGDQVVYHQYCDISIAVSAPKGLVVPVIRNAESLSMADIERKVVELATKARENKLTIEEMTGGTFTITNGGVF